MNTLPVPFLYQNNIHSCGAAVLEMVYRYMGLMNVDQSMIFNLYKKLEPHETGNYYIETEDIIKDAKERGFRVTLDRFDYKSKNVKKLKKILQEGNPIIVCQQHKQDSVLGHFRVVIGVTNQYVYLNDPDVENGGECLEWSHAQFLKYWQPTGKNVTGGIYFLIS